jgi:hypothetical protein
MDTLRKIEIGSIITIALAVIGAAVFIGRLDGRVSSLESGQEIKRNKETAISEMQNISKDLKDQLYSNIVSMPIGSVIDYIGPIESSGGSPEELLSNGYMVWAKGHSNWVVCNGATLPEDKFTAGTFPSDRWRAGERARRVKLGEPGLLCNSGRR